MACTLGLKEITSLEPVFLHHSFPPSFHWLILASEVACYFVLVCKSFEVLHTLC